METESTDQVGDFGPGLRPGCMPPLKEVFCNRLPLDFPKHHDRISKKTGVKACRCLILKPPRELAGFLSGRFFLVLDDLGMHAYFNVGSFSAGSHTGRPRVFT